MSRIVAGNARGRRLVMPAGRDTRPTSDRVREALFTSLEASTGSIAGLAFLDLYAGSGAVGAEALSRGARPVWLVERARAAAETIRRNLSTLGDSRQHATVRAQSVRSVLSGSAPQPFDVVFLDPPYAVSAESLAEVLRLLRRSDWLAVDAIVVVERASRDGFEWPDGFTADRERRYGDTTLWYGGPADARIGGFAGSDPGSDPGGGTDVGTGVDGSERSDDRSAEQEGEA